ncbi:MAG: BMC domain-containing protein [Ignavibacteriales bacterium]|nr:MAG: BMC domain-containing protein [Ignavibacteriales bacterium]
MSERNAIGIIELASIYKGFEVQDMVLKSANVEKIIARTICSGKYFMVFRGNYADVENAISVAKEVGGFSVVNATSIANLDPRIFPAIAGTTTIDINIPGKKIGAMLIIETFSVVSAIKAADYAAKEANLNILRIHVAMAVGGKGFVVITGDIDALEAAVKPAVEYIKQEGMLAGYVIIKNPHEEVLKELI